MKSFLMTTTALALCTAPAMFGLNANVSHAAGVESSWLVADSSQGQIEDVAADKSSFVIRTEDGRFMTILVNDETTYTLNGKDADRDSALQKGAQAKVEHNLRVATRVEVTTEGN